MPFIGYWTISLCLWAAWGMSPRGRGKVDTSSQWTDLRETVQARDAPAFLSLLRRDLVDGRLTVGVLHADLQSFCFAEVTASLQRRIPTPALMLHCILLCGFVRQIVPRCAAAEITRVRDGCGLGHA